MNRFLFFLVFSLLIQPLFAAARLAENLDDLHAASCRVIVRDSGGHGAIGTGTVFGCDRENYYILTNWHVVESHSRAILQFFGRGVKTECAGTVIASWHNDSQPFDFAVITVENTLLNQYDPPIVPLAPRGTRPEIGAMILSSGCSEGRWPMAWKGGIESYYGDTAQFFPAPKGGQSGSGIVERINGALYITAILTWRVGDERHTPEEQMRGGAIPIEKFYEAAEGKYRTRVPNSVPPHAVWCRANEKRTEVGRSIGGTGDQDRLEMIFFTQSGCIPCREAVPIVRSFTEKGYIIHTIDTGTSEGMEEAQSRKVLCTPTFIGYRTQDGGESWTEVTRFCGTDHLADRLEQFFCSGGGGALGPILDQYGGSLYQKNEKTPRLRPSFPQLPNFPPALPLDESSAVSYLYPLMLTLIILFGGWFLLWKK